VYVRVREVGKCVHLECAREFGCPLCSNVRGRARAAGGANQRTPVCLQRQHMLGACHPKVQGTQKILKPHAANHGKQHRCTNLGLSELRAGMNAYTCTHNVMTAVL